MSHISRMFNWYKDKLSQHKFKTISSSILIIVGIIIVISLVSAWLSPTPNYSGMDMKRFANNLPENKWEIYTGKLPKSSKSHMALSAFDEVQGAPQPTYTINGGTKNGVISNNENNSYCDYHISGGHLTIKNDDQLQNGNNDINHLDPGNETLKPLNTNRMTDIQIADSHKFKHLSTILMNPKASFLVFQSTHSRNVLFFQKDNN